MDDPNAYSSYWGSAVEQAYSCEGEYGDTLKIVKFNKRMNNFPRFISVPSKALDIGDLRSKANTLIVSEGTGTEISTVAGRSIFGNSEDTEELFSAGEFTHLKNHPENKSNSIESTRINIDRFLRGSPILLKGVVLNKKTGKMQALFLQNQAERDENFRYEPDYSTYECKKIQSAELFEFSNGVVNTLLSSMVQIRDRYKATVGVYTDENKAVAKNKLDTTGVSAEKNAPTVKAEHSKKSQEDSGPVENLKNPEAYSKKAANLVKFVLHCKNPSGATMRVAMFDYPLSSFPSLKVKHNEYQLKASKQYSFERLEVEATIRSVDVNATTSDKQYHTLVVFNGNTLDEIYTAGLSFYTNMNATDEQFYARSAMQLREGRSLPKDFWPPVKPAKSEIKNYTPPEQEHFSLDLNEIVINRYSLDTSIWLSAPYVPEYREKNKCTLSNNPKEDVRMLIKDVFKGISAEKERITKVGVEKKI